MPVLFEEDVLLKFFLGGLPLSADLMVGILVAVIVYLWWFERRKSLVLPASSHDWFIAVQTNADARTVIVTFFPILAFRLKKGLCLPITSRPGETDPLLVAHVANTELATKTSEKYGRWFRHGIRYDVFGAPCWSGLHFSVILAAYRHAQFSVAAINPPPEYAELIDSGQHEIRSVG